MEVLCGGESLSPERQEDIGFFQFLLMFLHMDKRLPWQFRLKGALIGTPLWIFVFMSLSKTEMALPFAITLFFAVMWHGFRIFTTIALCISRMITREYTPAAF